MEYIDHHILRLIHFDNLEDILKNGMYSKNSGHVIPSYVNIGDTTLIKQRETFKVRIAPPNGYLGDYVPFYFAGHSPMLLNLRPATEAFFNNTDDLSQLDWNMIGEQFWHDTEEDMDRMRRKQAEFLVKGHVPAKCLRGLIVLSPEQEEKAKLIQQKIGTCIPAYVDKHRKYFYP